MKTTRLLAFLAIALTSIALPSCDKEDETDNRTYIIVNWIRDFRTCQTALQFCLTLEGMDKRLADQFPLELDQAITAPTAKRDGSVEMNMSIPIEKLSGQAYMLFFEEEDFWVEEAFALSEITMEQAYKNSGLNYAGQIVEVAPGFYPIDRDLPGDPSTKTRIKITITIGDGKVTIKITWD